MAVVQTINSLGGIIGPIGFFTAVVFGTLYGRKKAEKEQDNGTIDAYEKNNVAIKKLLETRELEMKEQRENYEQKLSEAKILHEENQKRIETLEQKSNILENQVTQAPSITKLALQIGSQHNDMMTKMTNMTEELGNIAKAMQKV